MPRSYYLLLATSYLLTCCAGAPKTVKAGYNFTQIQRIALGTFEGQGGNVVGHEFVRQLVANGFAVTDQKQNAEVVLAGTVTDYRPSDKMLVFIGAAKFPGAKEQAVEVTNPIVHGATPTDVSALELPKIQMMAMSASVSVVARLIDAKTGETLWTSSEGYEGLTMPSAIQTMTSMLVHSIRSLIPVHA